MGLGRSLIIAGAILILAGLFFSLGGRLPFRIGRLPGDVVIRGRNSVLYFPLVTSLILSALFSLVLWFFNRR